MEYHDAANAFPLMDDNRYEDLLEDIRQHGLIEPITLCEGKILDGRNRYRACLELGIDPKFRIIEYGANPWDYVWSLNGERRDITDDQRYLVWKLCHEHSEEFQEEKRRIQEEANRKRSEAAKRRERTEEGTFEPVVEQSVPQVDRHEGKKAKAKASKTNPGAVARGDKLAKDRPDLAEKVRKGEMTSAEARRQMARDELTEKLQSIEAQEVKALEGVYDVIVIDPPWPMKKIDRDYYPEQTMFDYPTMTEAELQNLEIPAYDDCHVWLWTTHKFLPMALRLLKHWELKYICTFVWHKRGGFQPFGLPQYNCEFAVYAHKGSPKFIDTKAFMACFDGKRGAHSEKPEEFYDTIRRVTAGRRLDMFNRRKIEGFDGWGKEAR